MHQPHTVSFWGFILLALLGAGCRQGGNVTPPSRSAQEDVQPDLARLQEHVRVLGEDTAPHLLRDYLVAQLGQARLQSFQERPFRLTFRGDTLLVGVLAGRDAVHRRDAVVVTVVFTRENRAQVAAWLEVARMMEARSRVERVPERSVIFVLRTQEIVDDPSVWIPARLWPPEQIHATLGVVTWTEVPPLEPLGVYTAAWYERVLAASRIE